MRANRNIAVFVFFVIGVWIFSGSNLWAALSEEEKQDLYSKAKESFRKANEMAAEDPKKAEELYKQSVMRFERLVREGRVRNGKLYYNIGNGYFRMKDLGRAVLNYRRAQQYIPGDVNLIRNLEYARSRCRDRIEIPQKTRILKTLLFWHYDLTTHTRSLVFICCFIIFWAGAAVRLFAKQAFPRWVLISIGLILLLFFGSLIAEGIYKTGHIPGVVLENEVVARKGDGENFEPAFKNPLHQGTEFTLVEKRTDWYQIELPDGRRCWIPEDSTGLVRGQ